MKKQKKISLLKEVILNLDKSQTLLVNGGNAISWGHKSCGSWKRRTRMED